MDAAADTHPAPWLRKFEFDSKKARIAAQKSHAPDSARNADKDAQSLNDAHDAQTPQSELGVKLARVQMQLVSKMLKATDDPKTIGALARSFRDVREAYHLVTGQAKPGVIRETGRSGRQRSQAKPQPLPDDGPDSDAKAQSG